MDPIIFMTKVRSPAGKRAACLLIESVRAFGGEMSSCPFWVFDLDPQGKSRQDFDPAAVRIIPLDVPKNLRSYHFGDKVYACARAEEMAPDGVHSLVWIDPSCLVVNPPVLYDLAGEMDAAVRPVHIRNVGLREAEPLDAYWKKIYEAVGVRDIQFVVESFVDRQPIRAYFNTHAFTVNPDKRLLHAWLDGFEKLIGDQEFQVGACQDDLHQIFLHQAVLSALLAASLNPDRVRILPPDYNYPYNLHQSLAPDRRAEALNDFVSFTYEDRSIAPAGVTDIEIREPLRSWLAQHVPDAEIVNRQVGDVHLVGLLQHPYHRFGDHLRRDHALQHLGGELRPHLAPPGCVGGGRRDQVHVDAALAQLLR
jgi:hypothetical protein